MNYYIGQLFLLFLDEELNLRRSLFSRVEVETRYQSEKKAQACRKRTSDIKNTQIPYKSGQTTARFYVHNSSLLTL